MNLGDFGVTLPQQIVEGNIKAGLKRVNMPLKKLILLGLFAGMFIAGGGAASSVAMHNIANVGLARLVAGCIFPLGLMMIVFIGGELFTGDCMMIMGAMDKQYSILSAARVLLVVFLSNFVGAVVLTYLIYVSGQFDYSDGLLGAFTIKVAVGKVNLEFFPAFASGILCNIFVCAAVLMGNAAKDIVGKVWAIFFPIMAFVVCGYEHCVANMFYVPAGMLAMQNDAYVQKAIEAYGFTAEKLDTLNWSNYLLHSVIPVTLGNIVGGMVFIGMFLYWIHGDQIRKDHLKEVKDAAEQKKAEQKKAKTL